MAIFLHYCTFTFKRAEAVSFKSPFISSFSCMKTSYLINLGCEPPSLKMQVAPLSLRQMLEEFYREIFFQLCDNFGCHHYEFVS